MKQKESKKENNIIYIDNKNQPDSEAYQKGKYYNLLFQNKLKFSSTYKELRNCHSVQAMTKKLNRLKK